MRARDIMTTHVTTVAPTTRVRDAVRLMMKRHVSGLPVVNEAGEVVGIVTEADLLFKEAKPHPQAPVSEWCGRLLWLERWVSGYRKAKGRTVGEVMTRNVITAKEDTPVHVLASKMIRCRVNRLPIVRDGRLVGIVTRADILRVFLRRDEDLAGEARRIVDRFLSSGEEIRVDVRDGVITLRGRLAVRRSEAPAALGAPGRRQALLDRLWRIDGVVAIDDREVTHVFAEEAGVWE